MKWSEVIMVRSAGSNAKIPAKTLQDLMADVAKSSGKDDIKENRILRTLQTIPMR